MTPLLRQALPYLRPALPWAIAVLAAGGFKVGYDRQQRAIGAANARIEYLTDSLDVERSRGRQIAKAETVARDSFRTELARWQAMKRRVIEVPKWDTLPPDTVPGPERIVVRDSVRPPTLDEILRAADATIQRCTMTLDLCDARVANLTRQIVIIQGRESAVRQLVPSGATTMARTLRDVAIGYGIRWLHTTLTHKRNSSQ